MDRRFASLITLVPALLLAGCSDGAFASLNEPPGASILEPEVNAVFYEGEQVLLRGIVTDPRTRPEDLLVSWSSSLEGQLYEGPPDEDGQTALTLPLFEPGEHVITLRVVDPRGAIGVDVVGIRVLSNDAPQALILSPEIDGVYHSDVPVAFVGIVSDTEDEPGELVTHWTLDGSALDDPAPPDDAGYTNDVQLLAEGEHTLELTVTDTAFETSSAILTFVVGGPNGLPTCSLASPEDGDAFVSTEPVTFTGSAADPDVTPDHLTVEWSVSGVGLIGTTTPTSGGNIEFTHTGLPGGTPTVTMTVIDEVGATCVDSVDLVIESPPEVIITQPAPGATVPEGSPITFVAVASDIQDDDATLTLQFESSVDGPLGFGVADGVGGHTRTTILSPATHTITVSAEDSAGLVGTAQIDVTVSAPPSEPVVEIQPSSPASSDDLTALITTPSTDPEGDTISYSWSWTVNGAAVPAYAGATTIPAFETTQDDVWEVTVVASDGYSMGPPASDSVQIANSPPVTTAPVITPATLYTDTWATCTGFILSDPDGDSVNNTFAWEVNGSTINGAIGQYLGGAYFEKGDDVQCFVTPYDQYGFGTTAGSAVMVVQNSPPSTPVISVGPALPSPGDPLECSLATPGIDPDQGDGVTHDFSWTLNGVPTGITDPTIPGSSTQDGDTWLCTVTATDGTATSAPATASAYVCDHETWYTDGDGDGFGDFATEVIACAQPPGTVPEAGDCDDTDPTVYPTAGDTATDTVDSDCDGMDCEAGDFNGTYYVVCLDNGSWYDAESACITAGYDGLATFASAAEETFVVNLLIATGQPSQNPWIGLTDVGTPGQFYWTDGTPYGYQNWDTGQPDSGGSGADCAVLTAQQGSSGGWDDVTCTSGSAGWTSFACGQRP